MPLGVPEMRGHRLFAMSGSSVRADVVAGANGLLAVTRRAGSHRDGRRRGRACIDALDTARRVWQEAPGSRPIGEAVEQRSLSASRRATRRGCRSRSGAPSPRRRRSEAVRTAHRRWACHSAGTVSARKTPEGYYQVRGGIELRDRQVPGGRAVRRPPVDGDEDRRPRRRPRVRRGDPRQSTRTRCWPTTSRPRSTGTPPA